MLSLAKKLGVETHLRDSYYTSNECPGSENLKHLAEEINSKYIFAIILLLAGVAQR